jgi:NADPH-dependent 2,4-dienoyl-CoA reductase/sulfur reductase-like enzyme
VFLRVVCSQHVQLKVSGTVRGALNLRQALREQAEQGSMAKVVVVGAGIIGASISRHLAQRGAQVNILCFDVPRTPR